MTARWFYVVARWVEAMVILLFLGLYATAMYARDRATIWLMLAVWWGSSVLIGVTWPNRPKRLVS